MAKKVIVLKDISPIIKKGDILVKNNKAQYILKGHKEPESIQNKRFNQEKGKYEIYNTPNWYHKNLVDNSNYFKSI